MPLPRFVHASLLAAGLGLLVWGVLPPTSLVVDKSCEVAGFQASVSELIFGDRFWEAQIHAAVEARQWQERLPAMLEKAKRESDVDGIESKMTRLSNREQSADPSTLEKIQAEEQRQRMEEMAWLSSCEAIFRTRLQK